MSKTKTINITRKGLFIWAGLFLFIAGWMFVLGILVGRGTAPVTLDMDRLEKELIELKSALLKKESAQLESQGPQQTPATTDLGFYEALKQAKPDPDFKAAPEPRNPKPDEVTIKVRPVPEPPPPKTVTPAAKPAEKPVEKPKATIAKAPAPQPAPRATPTSTQGHFSIQVAAFKNADNSQRMVEKLKSQGFPAYHIQTPLANGSGHLYRVRVGAFEDRHAAETMLAKLQRRKLKGLVVATP
jgi:cell division septation protein DedD